MRNKKLSALVKVDPSILTLRGQKVILDSDLAQIYGVSTKRLNSPQAVQMSVFVVRAFIRLRQSLAGYAQLRRSLEELEERYDEQFAALFQAIRELMTPPEPPRKEIGFKIRESGAKYRTRRRQ